MTDPTRPPFDANAGQADDLEALGVVETILGGWTGEYHLPDPRLSAVDLLVNLPRRGFYLARIPPAEVPVRAHRHDDDGRDHATAPHHHGPDGQPVFHVVADGTTGMRRGD